jgi:hypothetical protein
VAEPSPYRPIYRASSCGGCMRALVAARLGFDPVEPPEFLARAAEAGSSWEERAVEWIESKVGQVSHRQEELVLRTPAYVLTGHIDGIAGNCLVEIKSVGKSRWELWRKERSVSAFPRYARQVAAYWRMWHESGRPRLDGVIFVVASRETGEIDTEAMPEVDGWPEGLVRWEDVHRRLLDAEVWARKGRLPDCDDDGYMAWRTCPYQYLCRAYEPRGSAVVDVDAWRLREWARRYVEARQREEEARALKEEARNKLVGIVGVGNRAEAMGYRVSVSVAKRRGIDLERLERDFGDALAPYRTETEYVQVRVTEASREGKSERERETDADAN